jgi:hypothetical protein
VVLAPPGGAREEERVKFAERRLASAMSTVVGLVGIISSVAAAILWFWASRIKVPDDMDTFIGELQRISRWNAWAALATGIAALCQAQGFANQMHWL